MYLNDFSGAMPPSVAYLMRSASSALSKLFMHSAYCCCLLKIAALAVNARVLPLNARAPPG
jgi:hypothetical protein